ncbi:hypothetical protein BGZ54_002822, partial [Gamsiella multidivaricata]
MFGYSFSSSGSTRSPQKELEVANTQLENARKANDPEIALQFCSDAKAALSRTKRAAKKALASPQSGADQTLRDGIANAYLEHGKLLDSLGYSAMAQTSYKKAAKWGHVQDIDQRSPDSSRPGNNKANSTHRALVSPVSLSAKSRLSSPSGSSGPHHRDIAQIPSGIFPQNVAKPVAKYDLPKSDERIASTPQLVYCLSLLSRASSLSSLSAVEIDEALDNTQRTWIQAKAEDADEQERLRLLATKLIAVFIDDELKAPATVTEVVYLAPVLDQGQYRKLLGSFIDGIGQSTLLDFNLLEGLAQMIQSASPGYLHADDLVKILGVLSTRLQDTHQQSTDHLYQLSLTVSHVLDAMADSHVKDLDRERLHAPLVAYLDGLKGSSDPYLVYQAAYAYQALQYVPDDETPMQAVLRRTRVVVKGVSGLVSAVKGLDLNGFIDGLGQLQGGLGEVYQLAKIGYEGVSSLVESGQDLMESLKEGLSFSQKRTWYPALRGIDTLLREGRLADFKTLICEAPCRRDFAFEWGLCQRLGGIATNPFWDASTRQSAIDFLGELYRNDADWGEHASVKQWILKILIQLTDSPDSTINTRARTLLQELQKNGDAKKQVLYRACMSEGPSPYPLKVCSPPLASPSLLDRVQDIPDVEYDLRLLRAKRLETRGKAVYIPPQAKASLQALDDALFPLMEKVNEFLSSDRQVLLLLGDSGAGKSTFSRELECV